MKQSRVYDKSLLNLLVKIQDAVGETRTLMGCPLEPKSSASTNFATTAKMFHLL